MGLNELIKKCTQRDRFAQEELYRNYSPMLYGICLKYAKNKMEAEDNLHDSFMTIYEKIGQFKSKGSFEGWLKRVTVNTILQKFRKEQHLQIVGENRIIEEEEIPSEMAAIDLQTLLGYIQELPSKYRATFNLFVLDGYSHNEISALMGTSTGTSKSNLARARNILKEKILNNMPKSAPAVVMLLFSLMLQ